MKLLFRTRCCLLNALLSSKYFCYYYYFFFFCYCKVFNLNFLLIFKCLFFSLQFFLLWLYHRHIQVAPTKHTCFKNMPSKSNTSAPIFLHASRRKVGTHIQTNIHTQICTGYLNKKKQCWQCRKRSKVGPNGFSFRRHFLFI